MSASHTSLAPAPLKISLLASLPPATVTRTAPTGMTPSKATPPSHRMPPPIMQDHHPLTSSLQVSPSNKTGPAPKSDPSTDNTAPNLTFDAHKADPDPSATASAHPSARQPRPSTPSFLRRLMF
ncbi:hypothetical protein BC826DRAFT_1030888 [Russula brevipes]|nr:hypothetical protein BC826DRAFT_1030888 [Russula brevipes]